MNESYKNFVKAGGGILVDTRTTQNPQREKEIPLSCTLITANQYIIENAMKMEKAGDNKYIKVEPKDGFAVIRGLPYHSRKKIGTDEKGKALYENYPASVASAFFSHNLCVCDEKSKEYLKDVKQSISSHLTGQKKWETNLAIMIPVSDIPDYKPVEALMKDEENSPVILVGGAFFLDDKEYGDFCNRLEGMGNKVVRMSTGNNHTFEEYSRFMEDVEIDFMSAKDSGLQEYNPMKEIVEKIDKTIADNDYVTPDMIVIPDKAKEIAEKEIYNGVSILENERRYYSKAFEGKDKKPAIKNETYEYVDKYDKKVKGSIWQSAAVHNEKLPSLDEILSACKAEFVSMSNYSAERIVSNTLDKMTVAAGKGPAKEKAPEKSRSDLSRA